VTETPIAAKASTTKPRTAPCPEPGLRQGGLRGAIGGILLQAKAAAKAASKATTEVATAAALLERRDAKPTKTPLAWPEEPRADEATPAAKVAPPTKMTVREACNTNTVFAARCVELFAHGRLLGRGGGGEVREVELRGKKYAVKKLGEDCAGELSLPGSLRNSPWVQGPIMFACGETTADGSSWYTLHELASGDLQHAMFGVHILALADAATPTDTFSMPRAAFQRVAAEAVVAVGAVHAAGMAHADVKPPNLLVTADGHLAIADFGLACEATELPIGKGTAGFMAPELGDASWWGGTMASLRAWLAQRVCGFAPDARPADVWALAVSLLHMLAPSPVDAAAVLRAARLPFAWQRRRALAKAATWLPPDLRSLLVERMLARCPRRRATLAEVQQHPFFASVDWQAVEARRTPLPKAFVEAVAPGKAWLLDGGSGCDAPA
jgi:serine/threonine protein kinase